MPQHPPVPKAPLPTRTFFDPYNSSSTGHQVHASALAGSTSWRNSRANKLSHQFRDTSGRGGEEHISDTVGAGSVNFGKDGRKENGDWETGAPGLRQEGWQDIRGLLGKTTRKRSNESIPADDQGQRVDKKRRKSETPTEFEASIPPPSYQEERDVREDEQLFAHTADRATPEPTEPPPPQIFRGLNIYLNGSTAPLISDHHLKKLFMQHGGNSSIMLGRRTTTHVIIGEKCGGGLASTKIQKEVATVGGKGIKFVTAQWVLDSIEKGIRQPEARYTPANLDQRIGGSGQKRVRGMFMKK